MQLSHSPLVATAAGTLVSLAALLQLSGGSSASCPVDSEDKCRCSKSASSRLDVGCYFKYPYDFEGISDEKSYTFRFSPCGDVECEPQTGAMCQYAADLDRWFVLGRTSELTWTVNSDSPLNFTIQYRDGEVGPDMTTPRKTMVTYVHSESSEMKIDFVTENPQLVYHFEVSGSEVEMVEKFSSCAGGSGTSGGVAVGIISTVLISLALVVVGLVAYCVVGAIVNYRAKGARGAEVIPNVSFWKQLPILIKDGFLLTLSPCISRVKRTKSGYDNV